MPIEIDPSVAVTEQQIQTTQASLADQEKQIATTQGQLDEAKQNLSVKVTAPRLSFTQQRSMTRLQQAQLKGEVGLTEQARVKSLTEVNKQDTAFKVEKQRFQTEATKIRSNIASTQSQIATYKSEVGKANREEAEWNYVRRMITRDKDWIILRHGSRSEKKKWNILKQSGFQSDEERKLGVYPQAFLNQLRKTDKVKDYLKGVEGLNLLKAELDFTISQSYGAGFNPGPTTVKLTKIPATVISGGTSRITTPQLDGNVNLGRDIRQATESFGRTGTVTLRNIPTTLTVPEASQKAILELDRMGKLSFTGDNTLREVTGGKFFLDEGVIKDTETKKVIPYQDFETVWQASFAKDFLKEQEKRKAQAQLDVLELEKVPEVEAVTFDKFGLEEPTEVTPFHEAIWRQAKGVSQVGIVAAKKGIQAGLYGAGKAIEYLAPKIEKGGDFIYDKGIKPIVEKKIRDVKFGIGATAVAGKFIYDKGIQPVAQQQLDKIKRDIEIGRQVIGAVTPKVKKGVEIGVGAVLTAQQIKDKAQRDATEFVTDKIIKPAISKEAEKIRKKIELGKAVGGIVIPKVKKGIEIGVGAALTVKQFESAVKKEAAEFAYDKVVKPSVEFITPGIKKGIEIYTKGKDIKEAAERAAFDQIIKPVVKGEIDKVKRKVEIVKLVGGASVGLSIAAVDKLKEWRKKKGEDFLNEEIVVAFDETGRPIKMTRQQAVVFQDATEPLTDAITGKSARERAGVTEAIPTGAVVLPGGDYRRRQDALTLYGWLPEWKEIKQKKLKAKEVSEAYGPALISYQSDVESHNVLASDFNSKIDTFDKSYTAAAKTIADEDYTEKELDNFITMTHERNALIDEWVPKLEASENKLDSSVKKLEGLGEDVVVKDEEGRIVSIKEPTITIGHVSPWKGEGIKLKYPVSWVKKKGLIGFTKDIVTKTLGRATGEFFEPVMADSMIIPVVEGDKISAEKLKLDMGKDTGKVWEVTYAVAPYFIPGTQAVGPFKIGTGAAVFVAETGAKIAEPTFTKGKYGGPATSWQYVKQNPIEVALAATMVGSSVYAAFQPTVTGIGTRLPTGKKFSSEFYKVNKKFISKGQESFVTTPWREYWRTSGIKSLKNIKPYYRASDYAKFTKTSPKQLNKIVDTLRGKRAIYNPARLFGKYPKTGLSKVKAVEFLKYKTEPFLIGRLPSAAEVEGVRSIVRGKKVFVQYKKGEYVRYNVEHQGKFSKELKIYRDVNLQKSLNLKDMNVYKQLTPKQLEALKHAKITVSKTVPAKFKALGQTFEPGSAAAKKAGIKIIKGPVVKNVYVNTPQISEFPKESIKFYQSGKSLPSYMKGTKVLSRQPIYIFEQISTRIVAIPIGERVGGANQQYQVYTDAFKKGQPYLGGKLVKGRGRVYDISGGKKLDPYYAYQTMSGDISNTNIATIKRKAVGKGLKKGLDEVSWTTVKSKMTNAKEHIGPRSVPAKYTKGGDRIDVIKQSRDLEHTYTNRGVEHYSTTPKDQHRFLDDLETGSGGFRTEKGVTLKSREIITGDIPKIKQKELFTQIRQVGDRQMAGVIQVGKPPGAIKSTTMSEASKKLWGETIKDINKENRLYEEKVRRMSEAEKLAEKKLKLKLIQESKIKAKADLWIKPTPSYVGGTGGPGSEGGLSYRGGGGYQPQISQTYGPTYGIQSKTSTTPQIQKIAVSSLNVPTVVPLITPLGIAAKTAPLIKTSQIGLSLLATAPTLIEATRPTLLTKTTITPSLASTQIPTTFTASKVSVDVIQQPAQKVTPTTATTTATTTTTTTTPTTPTVVPGTPATPGTPGPRPPVTPKQTFFIPPFKLPEIAKKKKMKKSKKPVVTEPGYNTLIKPLKKRNYVRANINPIKKKFAKDLGAKITDTTLGARFKISKAKKLAKKPLVPITKGYFEANKNKFRDFKYVKGKKKGLSNEWIEKKNKRLDTIGEIKKVQVLARVAKLKKGKKSKSTIPKVTSFGIGIKSPKIKTNTKFLGI